MLKSAATFASIWLVVTTASYLPVLRRARSRAHAAKAATKAGR